MFRVNHVAGIMTAFAYAGCGGDGSDINQPSRPANSISIVDRAETKGASAFDPSPLSTAIVNGAAVVYWYNDDQEPAGGQYGGSNGTIHNIVADDLSFSSGNIVPGARFEHTYRQLGDIGYHCAIHPTMKGFVTVMQ